MRIGDIFAAAVLIVLMILLSPILVPILIYLYVRDRINEHRLKSFLRANEGAKYFCYTARKTSKEYVTENVLPCLPPDTRVIYLGDYKNQVFSLGDDFPLLEQLVWRMKRTGGGYPYAAKISNGELVTISINNRIYSAIRRNADAHTINRRIRRFLEGDAD